MSRKQKLFVFFFAALVIGLGFIMVSGRAWFIPREPAEKEIQMDFSRVIGLTPQEKLANLLRQWNATAKGEYSVAGYYQVEKTLMGEIDAVNLEVALYFKASPSPGEIGKKMGTILGNIVITTAQVFTSNEAPEAKLGSIVISAINFIGETPRGEIYVYIIDRSGVEALRNATIQNWTKYAIVKPGAISVPTTGPVVVPVVVPAE